MASRAAMSSNPFYCGEDNEEDVDDFEFVNHPKQGRGYLLGNDPSNNVTDVDRRRQMMMEKKQELENSALASTKSSLSMVYESEQMGISTAEELVRQREQLQKCEDNVDEINSNLTISQKHLNSIKSVFGGIKNWWGQKSKDDATKFHAREVVPSSSLAAAMERSELENSAPANQDNHPAFRVRGLLDEEDEQPRGGLTSRQVDDQIDRNLGELSVGLGRLKSLAIGLGDEIEEQDEILTRLDSKVEKADTRVYGQNREMSRILKK